jgi:hypothetical protein
MLIEPDWLNMLDRGENKVTSFKLANYDFAAAFLDPSVLFLLTGMQTRIIAVNENGYILWLS